ncbi:MAG: 4Fe-4S binding protein [Nitrospirae bacterium]|nr:4Fe-4S binding protein [Nitrospirota bacterium]
MWRRYRRTAFVLQAAALTGLPFLEMNGESALRFDIAGLKLHFFGTVIWMNEFHLVLAGCIFLVLLTAAVTVAFGKVWCGWLCPQTVLLELAGWLVNGTSPGRRRVVVEKAVLMFFSAAASFTAISYFVPPSETAERLSAAGTVTAFFVVTGAAVYAVTALFGRSFCRSVCPCSMLQSVLFDGDTMVIAYAPDRGCTGCKRCVKVCPVGLDIRKGTARECIACAECIDACAASTGGRDGMFPVGYRGRVKRPKTFLFGAVALLSGLVLILLVSARPAVDFTVTRDALQGAEGVNSYRYSVRNNGNERLRLSLSVEGPFELIGAADVALEPYGARSGRVMLRALRRARTAVFVLRAGRVRIERRVAFL